MHNRQDELLQAAKRFDPLALGEIYDRYSPGLYGYAMRLVGDADLAEECIAETFKRFLSALRVGKGPSTFLQAYLYRVAHNWITDQYRRQPPPLPLDENLPNPEGSHPEQQVFERMQQAQVRAALFRLTAEQRQVIVLKYYEGWSNEEVAAVLGKPVGAVKSLQHRALDALRRLFVPEDEEYEPLRPTA